MGRRINLPKPTFDYDKIDFMATDAENARRLGVSESAIWTIRKKKGIKPAHVLYRESIIAKYHEIGGRRMTIRTLCERLQIKEWKIREILKKAKLPYLLDGGASIRESVGSRSNPVKRPSLMTTS